DAAPSKAPKPLPHRPSSILELCCCCPRFSTLRGTVCTVRLSAGESPGSQDSFMQPSFSAEFADKPPTSPNLKTGSSTSCSQSPGMPCSPARPALLHPAHAPRFLWSQQHRCCCSSSASTTPGTQSLTTSSCKNESSRKESASAR